ncbi:MAG: 5'-nucleotidase C-terminal domain-containing protein [Bacteroidia bacterium]
MSLRLSLVIIVQFFLTACGNHYQKQKESFAHFPVKENQPAQIANDSIYRFKKKIDVETGRVIAILTGDLTKEGNETTLGNFACDALKFGAELKFKTERVDAVIINRGGLRTTIPAGEIKVGNIFEVMPFENEIVIIKISGENLLKFMPLVAESKHPFSGMKIKVKDKSVVSLILAGDKEIDKTKIYTVVTSDYLANGGDNFSFLKAGEKFDTGLLVRDAMILYCEEMTREKKQITPYLDGRLEISK